MTNNEASNVDWENIIDELFPETKKGFSEIPEDLHEVYDRRLSEFKKDIPLITEDKARALDIPSNLDWLRDKLGLPSDITDLKLYGYAIGIVEVEKGDNEALPGKYYDFEEWYPLIDEYCNKASLRKFLRIPDATDEEVVAHVKNRFLAKDLFMQMQLDNIIDTGIAEAINKRISRIIKERVVESTREGVSRFLKSLPGTTLLYLDFTTLECDTGIKIPRELLHKRASEVVFEKGDDNS